MDANTELRNLMNQYWNRLKRLDKEKKEAKDNENVEDETTVEILQRQCRVMIAELFQTMKNIGILDSEEIDFGAVKK